MSTEQDQKHESFQLEAVRTEPCRIPLAKIVTRPEDFSFREDEELATEGETPLKRLAEDIKVHSGIHTPLQVKRQPDDMYLLIDGHRRFFALRMLVRDCVQGFSPAMPIPANVIVSDVGELTLVARSVSADVQREGLSAEGRLRAANRLHRLGMPRRDIAGLLNVSESTVDRDITLGSDNEMMDHVTRHHITATDAAALIKAAADKGRLDEFRQALSTWVDEVESRIHEEEARRIHADESSLSLIDRWPQRYLTADQKRAWKEAIDTGLGFGPPRFRFKAAIRKQKGRRRLEIDALSMDLDDAPLEHLAKVTGRIMDLMPKLQEAVGEKKKSTARAESVSDSPPGESPGTAFLRKLGLNPFEEDELVAAPEASDSAEAEDVEMPERADHTDGPARPEVRARRTLILLLVI